MTTTINDLRSRRASTWEKAKAFLTERQATNNGILTAEDDETYGRMEAEVEIVWAALNAASQALADLVEKGANATLTAGEYDQKYAAATHAYDQAQAKHSQLQEQVNEIRERKTRYDFYRRHLADLPQEQVVFTPLLFRTLIDHATAHTDGQIRFTFRDGQTMTPQID